MQTAEREDTRIIRRNESIKQSQATTTSSSSTTTTMPPLPSPSTKSSSSRPFSTTFGFILAALGLCCFAALHHTLWMLQDAPYNHHHHHHQGGLPQQVTVLQALRSGSPLRDDDDDDNDGFPRIAWLASFPNSGTSYTMTMVEQASNRSTATNYGLEVTDYKNPSIPLDSRYPEGPYWQGSHKHTLPAANSFILTKTHCGGRCVRCGATQYAVNATTFLHACARTTARLGKNTRLLDNLMDPRRVHKVVHLIRNPFTNIVARFHLESRNLFRREQRTGQWLPKNATGLRNFCQILDQFYASQEQGVLDEQVRRLMEGVPCRAEFYKWTQWHNRLGQVLPVLGPAKAGDGNSNHHIPVFTLYYEDYHARLNETANSVLEFLALEPTVLPYRAFRELPSYADHFTTQQRQAAWRLMQAVATPWTWERIQRYRQQEDF